jgi:hypothetical protein
MHHQPNCVREQDITPEALRDWADRGEEFNAAHLRGSTSPGTCLGELCGASARAYDTDRRRSRINYVIVSYGTPIAWRVGSRWRITTETISSSIARHQRLVCAAFGCASALPTTEKAGAA